MSHPARCQIPFDEKWDEIARKSMLFDRTRLAEKISKEEAATINGLEEKTLEKIENLKKFIEDSE